MAYQKKPTDKLHHIEIHPAQNGAIVERHIIRTMPKKAGEKMPEHMAYANDSGNYPNVKENYVAGDPDEAADHVAEVIKAHMGDMRR